MKEQTTVPVVTLRNDKLKQLKLYDSTDDTSDY